MNQDLSAWMGRHEEASDVLEPARSNALSAAFGEPAQRAQGDDLPPLHHWLYFWDVRPPAQVGPDGHPARGGFLPPVPLPRRMWAAGRLEFLRPLRLGERATRVSTIESVEEKSGRSGRLIFVGVRHELSSAGELAIVERQDIVYREPPPPDTAPPAAAKAASAGACWKREILPDTLLLFRYSALTMNGHRIHYDRPYATAEEGYPELVVHGPLQATLLAGLAASHLPGRMTRFEFRAQAPAFCGAPLQVCGAPEGEGAKLWTEQAGRQSVVATASCGEMQ